MKYVAVVFLLVATAITGYLVLFTDLSLFTWAADERKRPVLVGPEELVLEVDQTGIPDYPYFTYQSVNGLRGILSVAGTPPIQRAYEVSSPVAGKIGDLTPMQGITKGLDPDNLDFRGVWMNATYTDPSNPQLIRGIYHAEKVDQKAEDQTYYSVAYIESNDGGKTWTKPNHPNNYLITGFNEPGRVGGADPYSMVEVGDDMYLYYFEHTFNGKTRGMAVARAPKSEIQNSASWQKYFCSVKGKCNFKQPGIGGKFTKLSGLEGQSWVTKNTFINQFLAIDGGPLLRNDVVQFRQSPDGITFTDYGPAVNIGSSIGDGWFKVYTSILGLDGTTGTTGKEFYLYYVVINRDPIVGLPSTDKRHYLMRRKITLRDKVWISPRDPAITSVERYYNPVIKAHLYETEISSAPKDDNWRSEGIGFKININQTNGTIPLYRVKNATDFFMETNLKQIQAAEKAGYKSKKIVGYCWKDQVEETVPLYRLYNSKDTNHFYTANPKEKSAVESLPGWKTEGKVCFVKQ